MAVQHMARKQLSALAHASFSVANAIYASLNTHVYILCQQLQPASNSCSQCHRRAVLPPTLDSSCLLLQVVTLKDKLAVVLGKTQNDDKLIAALRSELAMASSRGQAAAAGSAAG